MMIGPRLGSYEILSQLGKGGMGEVYAARDTRLNREVASKILPAALKQDAERLRQTSTPTDNVFAKRRSLKDKPLVLVVEEYADSRSALRTLLELEGYKVIEADDAEHSVRLAEQRRPDLILLDVSLPTLAGLQAFQEMCQIPALAAVPIILTSGCNTRSFLDEVRAAGCQELFVKPLDFDELLSHVKRYLSSSARLAVSRKEQ